MAWLMKQIYTSSMAALQMHHFIMVVYLCCQLLPCQLTIYTHMRAVLHLLLAPLLI